MVAPKNYTTTITTSETVGQVQQMLAGHGARRVMIDYADRLPCAVSFELATDAGPRVFVMPVNVEGMAAVLARFAAMPGSSKGVSKAVLTSREHATRVAWRVLRDWLDAQLALVAAQMADLSEVMLPYLVVSPGGPTLGQVFRDRGLAALESGQGSS